MNRFGFLFLLLILVLLSSNSSLCAFHVSIPISSIQKESITEDPQRPEEPESPLPSQSRTKYEIQTISGDLVTVTQTMLPIKNDGYFSGETARMFVEIKNNKRIKAFKDLNELAVRVIIDDELGIIPDSAKWLKVYSLEDLCKIKTDLYTCPLDESPLIEGANSCQNNIQLEYQLFSYNNSTLNDSRNVEMLAEKLSDIYDLNWVDSDQLNIFELNNFFIINNSKNNSYAIFNKGKNDLIWVDFSDGRTYNLLTKTIMNYTYINYTNTIIGFNVDELSPKESVIFYYDVKPKKTGEYNVEVIVRAYDPELSHLQDLSFFSKIDVKEANPKFEIKPRPTNSEVYECDSFGGPHFINVSYDIIYIGGASEPYCNNNTIKFDPPTDDRFYVNQNGERQDNLSLESNFKNYSNFYMYETISIPMRIAFSKKNTYSLPGILVNDVHYAFNEEKINVDTWLSRRQNIIILFLSLASLIFTAIELIRTRGELRSISGLKLEKTKPSGWGSMGVNARRSISVVKLEKIKSDKTSWSALTIEFAKFYLLEIIILIILIILFTIMLNRY